MVDVKDKLLRIAELAGGDVLERDLALDLLREVYAEIKFGKQEAAVVDETMSEGEDCLSPEMPAFKVEPAVVEVEAPAAEVEPEPEPVIEVVPLPVVPRRVAPEVIRSLYGTDDAPEPEPRSRPEPKSQPAPALQSVPEPEPETKPATTLADAMAAGHKTLGETLRNGERDTASYLASQPSPGERPSIKRSIGLNDRFLMIRDMFGGDAAAFDRAVTRLDQFADLDDAVVWIRENFDWSAESRGAELLVGLLERKLGR